MSCARLPATVPVPERVAALVTTLEHAGHEAWCVGGALRDALLGLPHADFDVATSATPAEVRKIFRRTVAVGERYGTVGVLDDAGGLHEVTTFRQDVRTDGRHAEVRYGVSLDEDLARRDFTINALAYHPIRREWRDPFLGAKDLRERTIRAVGDPVARFREDYLRVLRGLRFAARFDFEIEPATWTAILGATAGLPQLSAERVRDEWFKSLRTGETVTGVAQLWRDAGAAGVLIPELRPAAGVEPHLSAAPRDPVLLTAALCREPGEVLRRLRASSAEIARVAAISAGPAMPAESSVVAVRQWLASVGAAADDLSRLHLMASGVPAPWSAMVEEIRARREPLARDELAIRGGDLLALGMSGPEIGRTLDRLLARVLGDPALNRRETLLTLAREGA